MVEIIQHLFGMCPDHAGHIDLLDIILYGGFGWMAIFSKSYFYKVKGFINKKRHQVMNKECDCDGQ